MQTNFYSSVPATRSNPLVRTTRNVHRKKPLVKEKLNGRWCNERGSSMDLRVDTNGFITGSYSTGVGLPHPGECFCVTGQAKDTLLNFSVNFERYESLAIWAGRYLVENEIELIETKWLLQANHGLAPAPESFWSSVITGIDVFQRNKP